MKRATPKPFMSPVYRASTVLDLGATAMPRYSVRLRARIHAHTPQESVRRDWSAVGHDIQRVLGRTTCGERR